ncbi:hypothetical protein CYMTET_36870, partial [Cymbomonas tetramitiformis]
MASMPYSSKANPGVSVQGLYWSAPPVYADVEVFGTELYYLQGVNEESMKRAMRSAGAAMCKCLIQVEGRRLPPCGPRTLSHARDTKEAKFIGSKDESVPLVGRALHLYPTQLGGSRQGFHPAVLGVGLKPRAGLEGKEPRGVISHLALCGHSQRRGRILVQNKVKGELGLQ